MTIPKLTLAQWCLLVDSADEQGHGYYCWNRQHSKALRRLGFIELVGYRIHATQAGRDYIETLSRAEPSS